VSRREEPVVLDFTMVTVAIIAFALCIAYVRACELL
jgi:hypothetical protein